MCKQKHIFLFFVISYFISTKYVAFAQLDNTYLQDKININPSDSNRLGVSVNVFNYMRNTEYFNKIEVGRTLFGYQLNPSLFYQANPYVKLQAGIFLRNDFGGENPYTFAAPTYTVKAQKNNFSFLFGTLESALSHRMIEPMFDVARVIENRLENGFQVKYVSDNIFFDTWINWEKFIERGSPFKEQLTTGANFDYTLFNPKTTNTKWNISIINQVMLSHRGGQIDKDSINKLYVKINTATGFRLSKKYTNHFIKELRFEPYLLLYKENSSSGMPFDNGLAYYINGFVDTKYLGVMLSYWNAQNFIAPQGTAVYQAQSIDNAAYFSPSNKRELFFVRFLYQKPLYDKLYMTARFEPFYDFKTTDIDYSYSFYVSYKMDNGFGKK